MEIGHNVYITKHKYVIRRYYLLCETFVEHPTSGASKVETRRLEQYYKLPERSEGNGYIVGFTSKEPQASYWYIRNIVYFYNTGKPSAQRERFLSDVCQMRSRFFTKL